jgi:MoxR-like ATPase
VAPPGTGKTALGRALAEQLLDLHVARPSPFFHSINAQSAASNPGRTIERGIAEAINKWKALASSHIQAPVPILFIDEADRANSKFIECFRTLLGEGYIELPSEPRITLPSNWSLLCLWVCNTGDENLRLQPTSDEVYRADRDRVRQALYGNFLREESMRRRVWVGVEESEQIVLLYKLQGEQQRARCREAIVAACLYFLKEWNTTLEFPPDAEAQMETWQDPCNTPIFELLNTRVRSALSTVDTRGETVHLLIDRNTVCVISANSLVAQVSAQAMLRLRE